MEVADYQTMNSVRLAKPEIRWMEIVLDQKDAADWVYRGEGAANLVLAYAGSSPAFIGKVMRLQKAPRNGLQLMKTSAVLSTHEHLLWRDVKDLVSSNDKDIANQLYVQHVMSPLLGPKFVDAGTRIFVTKEFLESVEEIVSGQRPTWRVDAGMVNTYSDSVVLLSDHSLFPQGACEGAPCISVEIKPKCGFLPISRFINEANFVKRGVTRFKMHQALKLHQGEISELSDYDPLDLFSGSMEHIYKAIKDLFSTPQNNFRVFLNGSLIFGAMGNIACDTNLEIRALFEDALKSVIWEDGGLRTKSFLQLIAKTVYKCGVLDRLLEVQKLDNLDIEGALHAYYDVISEPCLVCRELDADELHRYISLHSLPQDQCVKIVKDFLIAATTKDCSLIITFSPREDGDSWSPYDSIFLESTNQTFDYKVNFIDLDLKPLEKMERYYKLDKKIVSYYSQILMAQQEEDRITSTRVQESAY